MTGRTLNILYALCLVVIVGVMSWRDMNPKISAGAPNTVGLFAYHVGQGVTPAMIPSDSLPLTIEQGEFSSAPDGAPVWAQQGMTPVTIAQRTVSLVLHLRVIPKAPEETLRQIDGIVKSWESQGTEITALILEYTPPDHDFLPYIAFLQAARQMFRQHCNIMAATDAAALPALKNTDLGQMGNPPLFIISLPAPQVPAALLGQLKDLSFNLVLRFPAGVFPADVSMNDFKGIKSLAGLSYTLDANKPWPKKERGIGLFPKF